MGDIIKNFWEVFSLFSGVFVITTLSLIFIKEGVDSFKNIFLLLFKPIKYFEKNKEQIIKSYFSETLNKNFIKEVLQNILQELGIYNIEQIKKNIKILNMTIIEEELDPDIISLQKEYNLELKKLIIATTDKITVEVGVNGGKSVKYNYYVNLRKKLTNYTFAFKVSNLLIGHIKEIKNNNIDYDYIIVPRDGSQILGYFISVMLKIPLLIANNNIKWNTKQEGIFIDGNVNYNNFIESLENKKILLIDDAISGGNLIKKIINDLTRHKIKSVDIFTIICRKEKKCLEEFKEKDNINFYPFMKVDDKELKQLIEEKNDT